MKQMNNKLLSLTLVTILCGCASTKQEVNNMGLYKDSDARTRAYDSYDKAMELWPVPYDEVWVENEFGSTHIIVSGKESGPAIVMLPGLFADATMWFANVGPLAEHFRVYCPDHIVFGGKGEPGNQSIKDAQDYARWFKGLLKHFNEEEVTVIGLSYGSWLGLALAREMPKSISALVMLDPSETFIKMDGGIAWKGFWNFAFFPNRTKYGRFLDWLGGGYTNSQVEIWGEHMLDVIEYGSVRMFDIPQHRIYHAEDLSMVKIPVLIMAGGKPILYKDPEKLAQAAQVALPQAEIEIVPETGHSMNMERSSYVNERIVQFLLDQ